MSASVSSVAADPDLHRVVGAGRHVEDRVSSHSDSEPGGSTMPVSSASSRYAAGSNSSPVVHVAADEAPALGVDRRVLVALLEQHPAARVHEQDAGESGACLSR